MKNKAILVSIVAVFAIILTLNAVSASIADIIHIEEVRINGVLAAEDSITVTGHVSNNVPVEIEFTGATDADPAKDVEITVSIVGGGYKNKASDSTGRLVVYNNSRDMARFSIELPSSMDFEEETDEIFLEVEVSADNQKPETAYYPIRMQRDSYSLQFLSIDADEKVAAGSVLALDIVVKNNGNDRLDDTYVKASIPELGISQRVYFGDIESDSDIDYDHIRDSLNKRIYLAIPANAVSGVYNIQIEAYNYDAIATANKKVMISGVAKEETTTEDKDETKPVSPADQTIGANNTVLILTVILAIIFVVLLVVLIVLLAKKPAETEEFGETSYY